MVDNDVSLSEFMSVCVAKEQKDGNFQVEFPIFKGEDTCYVIGCPGPTPFDAIEDTYFYIRNIIENGGDSSRAFVRKKKPTLYEADKNSN